MYNVSNLIDEKFVDFAGKLPHGSGINGVWDAHETDKYVYFTNHFQCMNENGFYDGWQDFTIRFDATTINLYLDTASKAKRYAHPESKAKMENRAKMLAEILAESFTLQFNGGSYRAEKYYLRDYLEDTISYAIGNMQ